MSAQSHQRRPKTNDSKRLLLPAALGRLNYVVRGGDINDEKKKAARCGGLKVS